MVSLFCWQNELKFVNHYIIISENIIFTFMFRFPKEHQSFRNSGHKSVEEQMLSIPIYRYMCS